MEAKDVLFRDRSMQLSGVCFSNGGMEIVRKSNVDALVTPGSES